MIGDCVYQNGVKAGIDLVLGAITQMDFCDDIGCRIEGSGAHIHRCDVINLINALHDEIY